MRLPGEDDYISHFNTMLPAFKDERYIKVDGKCLFVIYNPLDNESIYRQMLPLWQKLAKKNGLNGFYFVGKSDKGRLRNEILASGYDAVYNDAVHNIHHMLPLWKKIMIEISQRLFKRPQVYQYKDAIKYMVGEEERDENSIPVIAPNWDHTPRSGNRGILFHNCLPKYFEKLVKYTIDIVKNKQPEHQIVFIKAWNEWGEGNYMEPDIKYGHGYLKVLRKVIIEEREFCSL